METNNRWYVRRKDGKKDGSFSDAELAALISKGIVEPEDEIWTVKMADWMVLKDSIYSFYLRMKKRRSFWKTRKKNSR